MIGRNFTVKKISENFLNAMQKISPENPYRKIVKNENIALSYDVNDLV